MLFLCLLAPYQTLCESNGHTYSSLHRLLFIFLVKSLLAALNHSVTYYVYAPSFLRLPPRFSTKIHHNTVHLYKCLSLYLLIFFVCFKLIDVNDYIHYTFTCQVFFENYFAGMYRTSSPSVAATITAQEASPIIFTEVLAISKIRSIPATSASPSSGSPTD